MMLKIASFITKFIAPPFCVACEDLLDDYTVLCELCHAQLPKILSVTVPITAARSLDVHAFTAYQKPCDKLIHAKLNSQQTPIYQLAYLLAGFAKTLSIPCDAVVPVPLHWQRKMWRGFNQAEILAQHVARVMQKTVINVLVRNKKTEFQSLLSREERQKNISGVFTINPKYAEQIKNKKIVLIDDLYTTGATAQAAAKELYKAGAESVSILVACKVID